jgi:epoxide hydrolase-like predicted phosphatase
MKNILLTSIVSILTATTLVAAPQAVVFDFGGVLTGEPNREAVVYFIQKSFNLSKEEFEKINQEKRLALKEGKTDEEFWLSYAKKKDVVLPADWGHSLKSVMKEAIGVNPQMVALVEELRGAQIPVALLSNIDERLSKLIRDFGLYESFNPCLLSCEIGVEKPDPKAYEVLLAKLDLPAKEVVFIDDRLENVEAAKKIGIDALLFESPQQLRKELLKRELLKS